MSDGRRWITFKSMILMGLRGIRFVLWCTALSILAPDRIRDNRDWLRVVPRSLSGVAMGTQRFSGFAGAAPGDAKPQKLPGGLLPAAIFASGKRHIALPGQPAPAWPREKGQTSGGHGFSPATAARERYMNYKSSSGTS